MTDKLQDKVWENFCKIPCGWEKRYKGGRFDLFVSIDKKSIGEPFPLAIHSSSGFCRRGEENRAGWSIPERYAAVGVYLGRTIVQKGQKRAKMAFAIPTANGSYRVYIAHSGIVNWFGSGEDEPSQQSGIRVDECYVANPANAEAINKKFGDRFKELSHLVG